MDESEMYECFNCGAVFSGREIVVQTETERHYWLDDSPVERLVMYCCPDCGSSDIDVHEEEYDDE